MKKLIQILCPFLLCGLVLTPNVSANTEVTVIRDGTVIASDVSNYLKNGRTYVSVKAFFEDQYHVSWDESTSTAIVGNNLMRFTKQEHAFFCEGNTYYAGAPIELVRGRLFVPVRALGEATGYDVSWNAQTKTVTLTSEESTKPEQAPEELPDNIPENKPESSPEATPPEPSPNYSEKDLYWLSRIICAESCMEPYEGKLAVGNVVLNRVASKDYPNTIYDVIFDRRYAVQFEPTINGTIYKTPDEECIRAAKECLDGKKVVGNCIYFLNPKTAANKWIIQNCTYITSIGSHDFYI